MKKNLLITIALIAGLLFSIVSCKKDTPPVQTLDQTIAEMEKNYKLNENYVSPLGVICCDTIAGNIIRDPSFTSILNPAHVYVAGPFRLKNRSMAGFNTNWFACDYLYNRPIVVYGPDFPCQPTTLHFWGKNDVGLSVSQDNLVFTAGRTYKIKFNAKLDAGDYSAGNTMFAVRLSKTGIYPATDIRTVVGGNYSSIKVGPVISSTSWNCYQFYFTADSNYSIIHIFPINNVNNSTDNSTTHHARVRIDDVQVW
jgi:hypothetical protein